MQPATWAGNTNRPPNVTLNFNAPLPWVWLAVGALHLLLLWSWREATMQPPPPSSRAAALLSVTIVPILPIGRSTPPLESQPDLHTATAPPSRVSHARERQIPQSQATRIDGKPAPADSPPALTGVTLDTTQTTVVAPDTGQLPQAPPAPSGPLMDSLATRQALRAMARQHPISEQAAQASAASAPTPGSKLTQSISKAGKGDCAKGEFAGAGMGLLSLPFLVAAVVRDECAQ